MRVDNSFKKLYLGKEEREGAITTAAHRVDEGVFIPMCKYLSMLQNNEKESVDKKG